MPTLRVGRHSFELEAVLFDKDGTLIEMNATWVPAAWAWIDTAADGDPVLREMLADRLGVTPDSVVADGLFAISTFDAIAHVTNEVMLGHGVLDTDARLQNAVKDSNATALECLTPLGDVAAAISRLRRGGLRLGVVTSDDRVGTVMALTALGIEGHIDSIAAGDDGHAPKPSPESLLAAIRDLGATPSSVVYVGDSEVDRLAAVAAGVVAFIAIGDPDSPNLADAVVTDIGQLDVG